MYGTQVVAAMFHANSGGRTCSYQDCFGGANIPYLQSKEEPQKDSLRKISGGESRSRINPTELVKTLRESGVKFNDNDVLSFLPTVRNGSDRALQAIVKGPTGSAVVSQEVLTHLRYEFDIPTAYFDGGTRAKTDKDLTVVSYGWGHGVGICQEGARLQAQHGKTYKDIIAFYYTSTSVVDLKKALPGSF
jgi:stage II sporulation protein D